MSHIPNSHKVATNIDNIGYLLKNHLWNDKKRFVRKQQFIKKFKIVVVKPQKKYIYISEDTILKYIHKILSYSLIYYLVYIYLIVRLLKLYT